MEKRQNIVHDRTGQIITNTYANSLESVPIPLSLDPLKQLDLHL